MAPPVCFFVYCDSIGCNARADGASWGPGAIQNAKGEGWLVTDEYHFCPDCRERFEWQVDGIQEK